jgi:hypothetical protein
LAEKAKQQVNIHPVEGSEDDRVNSDGAVPELDVHGEEVAVKTVTVESAVDEGNLEEDMQPPLPAVCDTDPGGLMDEEEDRILDLVYLDAYVHFTTQRVQGAPVHTTSSFAIFKKGGNRTRRDPLDIKGYQTLDTGWGLGRIRAQEGGNLDSAVDPVPPDSTNLGIYDENFPVYQV